MLMDCILLVTCFQCISTGIIIRVVLQLRCDTGSSVLLSTDVFSYFFQMPNLRGRLVDRHQILTRSVVTLIYKIRSGNLGLLHPKKHQNLGLISNNLAAWSQMSPSRNKIPPKGNHIANCNLFLIWWTLVHKWRKIGSEFRATQGALIVWVAFDREYVRYISGTKQGIVEWKMALQTVISPVHAHLTWWTLVHKQWKIGPEFRPT